MSRVLQNPSIAVVGGLLLTAPFIILEWINTPGFLSMGIPPLFFIMWLSGSIFTFTLGSFLQTLKNKKKNNRLALLLKGAVLILMAWIFVGLVRDQWACFMGIPNCD